MKITHNFLRRKRKQLTPNNVAETKFLMSVKKLVRKQLKLPKDSTIEDILNSLDKIDLTGLLKKSNILAEEVLRKNSKGFSSIMQALVAAADTQEKIKKAKRQEELFKKALGNFTRQKQIYQPLLNKFNENIQLIKNLPKDIADELQAAYLKGEGFRGQDIESLLEERLGKRARVIIRTESSKLNSALTEVRSKALGIKGYIWSSSGDSVVRPSHNLVNGVLFFYNDPPSLDKMTGNAGEYPNCRCCPVPVFDLDDITFPVRVGEHLVVISKYDKATKKYKAQIVYGRIVTYTKEQFINKYSIRS